MNTFGWTITCGFTNNDDACEHYGEISLFDFSLNKFPKDRIKKDTEDYLCFLDGYIYDKELFSDGSDDWKEHFCSEMCTRISECLTKLRGGFRGVYVNKLKNVTYVYTDQTSNKAIYYYSEGSRWMVGTNLDSMVSKLRDEGCWISFNETAAQYMLTYGFMLDDSTFVSEIKRVMPGQYITISNGKIEKCIYYQIPSTEISMSEEEAIELIDDRFRNAVRREFEKDKEYGYRHLVDLSGGLDSRMVSWVAHSMGYTEQINMTYCRAGYLDETIATQIAKSLKHEFVFKMLDDLSWMQDIDSITSMNNGAALFLGITGGSRMLDTLDTGKFGIEHTGMIGDAILSTFYHDREFNFGTPQFGFNRYSDRMDYDFNKEVLERYPNQEQFAVYTRGILGAQSSYITRQHYVETSSPFMDVDFLEAVFSVPFEYRRKHHLYLRWIKEKYPEASEFGWEKWGGIKPREDQIWKRKCKTAFRLLDINLLKLINRSDKYHMNPYDYWFDNNQNIQMVFDKYFKDTINSPILSDSLRADITVMFYDGNVIEKGMALTVLAEIKKYFRNR